MNDPFAGFKAAQREGWALFSRLESMTTPPAGRLVAFVNIKSGEKVLDVACGTGVVAITAARRGAAVKGLDLAPALLERARFNAKLAGVDIEFIEGDAEALPYADASFDVVMSQYGHIFAPRPAIAMQEMLRVLRPGGKIAFSTWPPELFTGRLFDLVGRYVPPPPGVPSVTEWGTPDIVRTRLGDSVKDIMFDRDVMQTPCLSPQHFRSNIEETAAPLVKLVESLKSDQPRLTEFRHELEALIAQYLEHNVLRQHYLMARAIKR